MSYFYNLTSIQYYCQIEDILCFWTSSRSLSFLTMDTFYGFLSACSLFSMCQVSVPFLEDLNMQDPTIIILLLFSCRIIAQLSILYMCTVSIPIIAVFLIWLLISVQLRICKFTVPTAAMSQYFTCSHLDNQPSLNIIVYLW